jgi:hypothetical protein
MLASLMTIASSANRAAPADDSAHTGVVIVELFTSEGCSSCPPADKLLRDINGKRTDNGQLVVGISEHVTYWNSLGWKDPFSSDTFTNRQEDYRARFGIDSVYTPQMVVNGAEQFVGSDQSKLDNAIQREQQTPNPIAIRIESTAMKNGKLAIEFSAAGDFPNAGVDVFALLTDDADQSSVARGENSGRTLTHVSVARSLHRVAELRGDSTQTAEVPLPPTFVTLQGHHIVLLAQSVGTGRVLGADTKRLQDSPLVPASY